VPRTEVLARLAQQEPIYRQNDSGFVGYGNEFSRKGETFRPLPSAQRLKTNHLAALQRDDGLVVDPEFDQFQTSAQVSF